MADPMAAFLSSVGSQIVGPAASSFGNKISEALFGRSDRISNRDYQFYQDLADSGNRRDIARQNEFLAGVTPTNAAQHNVYQDLTRPQETQRNIDSIKAMGDQLGMSPWELTGSGGASPLPSPTMGPEQGSNTAPAFMAQMTPLAVTKMNNENALQIAAMNNKTALEQTRMTNETSRYSTDVTSQTSKENVLVQTGGGLVPLSQLPVNTQNVLESQARVVLNGIQQGLVKAQTANVGADTALKGAQKANTEQQTQESQSRVIAMKDETIIKALTAIWPYLPKTTISTPLGGVEERTGANDFLKGFGTLQTNSGMAQVVADALGRADDRQWNSVLDVIKGIAGVQ